MKIGEILIKEGLISSEELKSVLREQESTHERIGDIILQKGLATSETIAPVLAKYFQIPFVDLKDIYKDLKPEVIDCIPKELAHRFNTIPIERKNNTLTLAMFDPLNLLAIDTLRNKTGCKIERVIAPEDDIKEAIEYCYHNMPRMKEHIDNYFDTENIEVQTDTEQDHLNHEYAAGDQPVVQFVQSLIVQAVNSRASDILIQPKEEVAELRFRIDGVLYHIDPPPKAMLSAISTRIKIMAGLDIAERRLPQDGRFKANICKNEVDIRISSFPTIYGESIVMRLLNTSAPLLAIKQLGFYSKDLERYRNILNRPYGLILVTGPTGSGKTTTLYTSLNEIKSAVKNIVTLEDPVEYRLPFIQQSQVNSKIGFDFARGLRSLLRQDPDIIMVGEIRDQETAEIAIHAALTGHLVFATLHTNDAASAPVRLIKMGVEPFLITSSLLGVVGQRLIRTVCPQCRKICELDNDMKDKLGLSEKINQYYRGEGCLKCMHSGYSGRQGLYELLIPNEGTRKMILEQRSSEEIKAEAQKGGMKTLREIGIDNFKEGRTTPEELLRVTQETEEL